MKDDYVLNWVDTQLDKYENDDSIHGQVREELAYIAQAFRKIPVTTSEWTNSFEVAVAGGQQRRRQKIVNELNWGLENNILVEKTETFALYDERVSSTRIRRALINNDFNLAEKEFCTIRTEDAELNAWMIKPPNFDNNKEYPLYMFLYGGPGSQQVTNSFGWTNYYWYQMLAQKGYIVACVDNRGTGGKGSEFKKMTYKELGKYETIDQIDASKYFCNSSIINIFKYYNSNYEYSSNTSFSC